MPTELSGESGFAAFRLHESLTKAIHKVGFETPTPIQQQTITDAMAGKDILGLAQTGTGKTAAFALPMLHRLLTGNSRGTRALILAPTRELASQINTEIRALAQLSPIKTITIFGGVGANPQIQNLRKKPDIIIACPGRFLDLFRQGHVFLKKIETFVLDEADQMFDMGFLPDIRRIIAELPEQRQNLLFSATMPKDIRVLAKDILQDPSVVEVDFKGPAKTVKHALYPVAQRRKTELLRVLLKQEKVSTAIVFTRTKHRARKIARQLEQYGLNAAALQGNMSQQQRDRVMREFRKNKIDVLVATDIVARGIDVASVSHVINYDVPATAEAYTHRIGRTGRARQQGEAYTLVTAEDRRIVREIEKKIGRKIDRCHEPGFAEVDHQESPGKSAKPSGEHAKPNPHHNKKPRSKDNDGPRRRKQKPGPKSASSKRDQHLQGDQPGSAAPAERRGSNQEPGKRDNRKRRNRRRNHGGAPQQTSRKPGT